MLPAKKAALESLQTLKKVSHVYKGGLSRTTIYAAIGNVVEFYDFTLFAYLMPFIAKLFFPLNSGVSPVLLGVLTFGVSFFARPLGALFFGWIGDLYDRSLGFILSLLFMICATIGLAILPTYDSWGVWASFSLVFLRILQAFSAGGEYSGAAIIAVENSDHRHHYVAGAAIVASSVAGSFFALCVAQVLMRYGTQSMMWRLGFALGAVNSLVAFALRSKIRRGIKTMAGAPANKTHRFTISKHAAWARAWWCVFMVAGFSGLFFYTSFSFVGLSLTTINKWSFYDANILNGVGMLTAVLTLGLMSQVYQRFGGQKPMFVGCVLLMLVGVPALGFVLQSAHLHEAIIPHMIFNVCLIAAQGGIHGLFVPLFPDFIRFRGYGLSYGLGLAVFGGTANYFLLKLQAMATDGVGVQAYLLMMTIAAAVCYRYIVPQLPQFSHKPTVP